MNVRCNRKHLNINMGLEEPPQLRQAYKIVDCWQIISTQKWNLTAKMSVFGNMEEELKPRRYYRTISGQKHKCHPELVRIIGTTIFQVCNSENLLRKCKLRISYNQLQLYCSCNYKLKSVIRMVQLLAQLKSYLVAEPLKILTALNVSLPSRNYLFPSVNDLCHSSTAVFSISLIFAEVIFAVADPSSFESF